MYSGPQKYMLWMLNNNMLTISLLERNTQKTNYRVQQYTIDMHVPTMALLSLLTQLADGQ